MIIDEGFKALIPALTEEEFGMLEDSILAEGCRDALIVWEDTLVDGHNRYEICEKHSVEFKTIQMKFYDRNEAKNWMIDNQLSRRNITPEQRTYLLGIRYKQEKKQGERNDLTSGQNVHKLKAMDKMSTAQKIADQNNVSEKTIRRSEEFADGIDNISKIAPNQKAKVLSGESGLTKDDVAAFSNLSDDKVMSIKEKIATLNADEKKVYKDIAKELKNEVKEQNKQKRIDAEKKELDDAITVEEEKPIIYKCDCLDKLNDINDIDLLIADPPYFTDGDFTSHISKYLAKVKPTGQAYVFAGADPKEMAAYLAIETTMELAQVLVWNYNNTGQKQPNERYNSNFQVCFYFRGAQAPQINKPADGKEQYACQTINAPDARVGDRYHKWQKPLEYIERLIKNSSNPGDFVFDPFACTGTTLVAAGKLGRKAAGTEIDQEAIDICISRGCIHG